MCGRYQLSLPFEDVVEHFDIPGTPDLEFTTRFNIAPTQLVPVVRNGTGQRELVTLRWGLVPHWAQNADSAARMINARSETVSEKPSFRDAFRQARCLVPTTGFYEWKKEGSKRTPYLIQVEGAPLYAMAGIWSRWAGPDGPLETFSVLTTEAAPSIADVHERMPVILHPDHYGDWLHPSAPRDYLLSLCQTLPDALIRRTEVGDYVNSARNEGPECETPGPTQGTLL